MAELLQGKVGLISCSGEEMPEGTISRLATRKVLESQRPGQTVTICLPLFLAGGEGERAFARSYPTIAIDGCEKRCAARGTEMYSGKPAASIVVSELSSYQREELGTARRLAVKGEEMVNITAFAVSKLVDTLILGNPAVSIKTGDRSVASAAPSPTCSCGSGIPGRKLLIDSQEINVPSLPLIYDSWRRAGKSPNEGISIEMMQTVSVYYPIPENDQETWRRALTLDFARYCSE